MASNQKKYNTYRLTFGEMVYESYSYSVDAEGLKLEFAFRLNDKIVFRPTAAIPRRPFLDFNQPKELMDILVFNIGMIELVSYWKCVCPPVVRVLPHSLDDEQIRFWKKIYFNGLGEFFYTNGINASQDDFMTIVSNPQSAVSWQATQALKPSSTQAITNYLVPIGGGKDSVVTLEALRPRGVRPLIMNPRGATTLCAERGGFSPEETLVINRRIDPLLLDLNAKGCLNGHTPFSAMLAFYSLLIATLAGRSRIALSNESSANEPTVQGSDVNHQYSKSIAFESDFREYVARHLTESISYHSFLRPLSELQIAMLFSRCSAYHPVFRSCNVGSKQDIWCGHCPKCLFTCIMLSAFLPEEKVREIFGKGLLEDETLWPVMKELCGETDVKPFECVGTREEVCMALCEIIRQYGNRDESLPTLLTSFKRTALYEAYRQRDFQPLLSAWDPHHFLPEDEELLLRKALGI